MTTPSRVLVIGIDGVRLDVLQSAATPHLDSVAAAGFFAPVRIDDATPTWSGPCWATVATGVSADKHGITHNVFTGHRLSEHPDFLTLASLAGKRTYLSVGSWEPLATAACGGPLFAAPDRVTFTSYGLDCDRGDEAATVDAERELLAADYDVAFVYLGDVDETGHELGVGAEYTAAVERADARVGRLLATLRARPAYEAEQWTVILVTDHGHVDAGGHGGDSDVERTAWIVASGPGIVAGAEMGTLRHVDVAAHVYEAVGLAGEMDGLALEGKAFAAVA
ncbi:alkaline phosphatase family protein [Catenulispora sp. NF23]|uniref:Alkaline phosphatase family protein n=1 Tax=Catenulispora pinistramenti TaxID=2705254 RepID=A0ABS5KIS8_9ACTN|nr:alkaline phosphatase family protein [Catenulispora pinistramenti]MBS2532583.1 alkaline phosphatase family protein [Catenulispora pinistramenti]MBS2546309.1 alkaline phosphatase family protein [Catenulispora pinistramenti]